MCGHYQPPLLYISDFSSKVGPACITCGSLPAKRLMMRITFNWFEEFAKNLLTRLSWYYQHLFWQLKLCRIMKLIKSSHLVIYVINEGLGGCCCLISNIAGQDTRTKGNSFNYKKTVNPRESDDSSASGRRSDECFRMELNYCPDASMRVQTRTVNARWNPAWKFENVSCFKYYK